MKCFAVFLAATSIILSGNAFAQKGGSSGGYSGGGSASYSGGSSAGYSGGHSGGSSSGGYSGGHSSYSSAGSQSSGHASSGYSGHSASYHGVAESYDHIAAYKSATGAVYAFRTDEASGGLPVSFRAGGMTNYISNSSIVYYPSVTSASVSRFNFKAQRSFPYYSSLTSKTKSYAHYTDHPHIYLRRPRPELYGEIARAYYPAFLYCDFYYPFLFTYFDEAPGVTKTESVTLDGYLVYDRDTMSGIITMEKDRALLEQPHNAHNESVYTAKFDDRYLRAITLFEGNRELYLVRLSASDKHLWRLVHSGRINVYDDRSTFPTVNNIDKANLRISYAGDGVKTISGKAQLVDYINKVYSLHLTAKDYSWKQLFGLIDTLD